MPEIEDAVDYALAQSGKQSQAKLWSALAARSSQ